VKRCGKCGESKPLTAFHAYARDGRQLWCKDCRRTYDAAYHQRVKDRRRERKRARRAEMTAWFYALKASLACTDCEQRVHHAALHFDHLPGHGKRADLSNLVQHACKQTVLDEIAKCEPVCANCHAVRTFERARGVAQPG
jgi:hypothetical protein